MKIGLVGLGYLGKIHLKLLKEISDFELVGVFDLNKEITQSLAKEFNVKAFDSLNQLIEHCDAIDIVTPSSTHHQIALECLKSKKHLFIEKPVTSTLEEAKELLAVSTSENLIIQVGHVERFNPAFIAARTSINQPKLIEFQRLAKYNPRGTDVSVTLDLMIHDLDLLLSMNDSKVIHLEVFGQKLLSQTFDIVNARINFENGVIASLTVNRTALDNQRKFTVYQKDMTILVDLLNKKTEIIEFITKHSKSNGLKDSIEAKNLEKEIVHHIPIILQTNAIKEELMAFHNSIITATKPVVTLKNAVDVLSLAFEIDKKLKVS